MKIIEINPLNYYSCMHCQKEFISKIELRFIWFCSKSCKYKFAFAIVCGVFPRASKEKKFDLTKKICEVSLNGNS